MIFNRTFLDTFVWKFELCDWTCQKSVVKLFAESSSHYSMHSSFNARKNIDGRNAECVFIGIQSDEKDPKHASLSSGFGSILCLKELLFLANNCFEL